MWKDVCDELPYWNRSQLSSSCDDEEDDEEDDEDDAERDAAADADADELVADDVIRARAVSSVPRAAFVLPSFAPSVERALSSDSSRGESGRSIAAELESAVDALARAVAEGVAGAVDCGAAAGRYGCNAASGTMMNRVARALMSVRPLERG